jgi:glucose/arabinose dehydrogenase
MTVTDPSLEVVFDGLFYPTSLVVRDGVFFVAESGLPFGGAPPGGRVWRLGPGAERSLIAEGLRHPVNGLTLHDNHLYISEGGFPGRISRIGLDGGGRETILDNLPGNGNYHTNMTVFGPDGKLYFSQGALTNTGIVGLDAYEMAWLRHLPHDVDVPGYPVTLTGVNFETPNPLSDQDGARAFTGAFSAFGQTTEPGQRVAAGLPCTASVMRCNPDGSGLELVAWGLRNAYGLGFLPDGRLLAVDQGADDRGSRRVGNVPDLLFDVRQGAWYGWPDFVGDVPMTDPRYTPEDGTPRSFLLANHHELPPPEAPLLRFPVHCAAVKFDIAPANAPAWAGHMFVALFGDEVPMTAPSGPRVGRSVARVDPSDWSLHPFPASGLARPIDVRFDAAGDAMYILDFGHFEMLGGGRLDTTAGSGKIWRRSLRA